MPLFTDLFGTLFKVPPSILGAHSLLLRLPGIAIVDGCWSASNWNELAITTLNAFSVARELWWELELANGNTSSHCQDSYHKNPLLLPSSAGKSPLRKPRMTPAITVPPHLLILFLLFRSIFVWCPPTCLRLLSLLRYIQSLWPRPKLLLFPPRSLLF